MAESVKPATDEQIEDWRQPPKSTHLAEMIPVTIHPGGHITMRPSERKLGEYSFVGHVDPKVLSLIARIDQLKAQVSALSQPAAYW